MSNLTPRINKLEKNIIIDGAMEIWPEGTTRSLPNNVALYSSVLLRDFNINTGITCIASRITDIPSSTNLVYANRISKSAVGSLAANTYVVRNYSVEGYDLSSILNNDYTVLFLVRSSVASTRSVSIRNASLSHSFVKQYTINQANTWELKALKFDAMGTCPGTVEKTNDRGLVATFTVVAGSSFQTPTLNQWVSNQFLSGVGEDTTWLTGTNHSFDITGVMIVPGDYTDMTLAEYEYVRAGRNFQDELSMTQRYLEIGSNWISSNVTAATAYAVITNFMVEKRATPTVSLTNVAASAFPATSGSLLGVGTLFFLESRTANATVNGGFYQSSFVADARFQ